MAAAFRFGLLGRDISYSRSPELFRILFDQDKVSGSFELFDVSREDLQSTIDKVKDSFQGICVTVPYKADVREFLDDEAGEVSVIGAVNSIKIENGKLHGTNTDWIGFGDSLAEGKREYQSALVIGAGGAARAVLYALFRNCPDATIFVCGRRIKVTRDMIDHMTLTHKSIRLSVAEEIHRDDNYDLIVNCTPLGGIASPNDSPLPPDFAFAGTPMCYDLVYEPAQTRFLKDAKAHGCIVKNGLEMLARQGIASYQWWTGRSVDTDAVLASFLRNNSI
jgi:shikimate dehydrogenase